MSPVSSKPPDHVPYTVLSTRAIWSAAALIVLVGIGMSVWLLLAFGSGDNQSRNQLEAIKTAGTVVVGAGGAAALLLTARRQRTAEIALKQKDREQAHQERVAAAVEADAAERRITDLYTKAADQLGSDRAPVRLGGLYALERVAQNNQDQRQTIVNLLCAYLRMPYRLPKNAEDRAPTEEREVRVTAQRLLVEHLRPGTRFWPDIALDLSGALLIDFDLGGCTVRQATFMGATFHNDAYFASTTFSSRADFWLATFHAQAVFRNAEFQENAHFGRSTANGPTTFQNAKFTGTADFQDATFKQATTFHMASFASPPGTSEQLAAGEGRRPYTVFEGTTFTQGQPPEITRLLTRPATEEQ